MSGIFNPPTGGGGGGVPEGIIFPASPTENDKFYRTDRNIEYYFDGTRWLSTQLFTMSMDNYVDIGNANIGALTAARNKPFTGVYDLYVESVQTSILKTAGAWTLEFQVDGVTVATHVYSGANGVYTSQTTDLNLVTLASSALMITLNQAVNNFGVASGMMLYRVIG